MPSNRIFYLGHFARIDNPDNRYYSPAARNKMHYIIACLQEIFSEVNVISASWTVGERKVEYSVEKDENVTYSYFKSLPKSSRFSYWFDIEYINVQLYKYLKKHIKKDDTLIVYHSLYYMPVIKALKKEIGFRLVLEFEEFYGDVKNEAKTSVKELAFSELADAFIFPSEMLNSRVNKDSKPYVIIYGTYGVEKDRGVIRNDNLTHIVYAGTLDPRKGALAAAALGSYLPTTYRVHILGFGDDKEIQIVRRTIKDSANHGAKVTYDGLLNGEDYIRFLQSCDIGLCTQDLDASFNATSFPSKILSYLSNGLRVVCADLDAIKCSKISNLLFFYDKQSSEEIAKTIQKIDFEEPYDSRVTIKKLDEKFRFDLRKMLQR